MTVRILLVDDHQLMREGLRKILENASGIEVVGEADDGRAAIAAVQQLAPDIVLMDIGMNAMNGIDATRRIRKDFPHVKVVALSTHSDKRYVRNMIQAGVCGYVLKEAAGDDLIRAVQAAARGEHYLSPQITGCALETWTGQAGARSSSVYEVLGSREREVLQLLAEGKTSKEIAVAMRLSVKTVETHRRNIGQKLGLRSIAELTKYAVREGLTPLE